MGDLPPVSLKGTDLRPLPNGDFEIKVYLCNDSKTSQKVRVTSHPWDSDGNKFPSKPDVKDVDIPVYKCVIVAFGPYPAAHKPHRNYLDVYVEDNTGELGNWKFIDGDMSLFASLVLPPRENGRTALAFAAPIPYPWRYDLAGFGPRTFFVRRVSGLPPAWRVAFLRPGIGRRFRMSPETKHWPLLIEVSTKRPVKPSLRFNINVEIVMVDKLVRGGRTRIISYPVAARPTSPEPILTNERYISADIKTVSFDAIRRQKFLVPES